MAISKVVVIEISDYKTRICEMAYNKKHPVIYQSVDFKNPTHSVEDGYIVDQETYGIQLKEKLQEASIRCKEVVFVLSSNKVLNREIVIPTMKDKLVAEYIESERESFFPMDTSNHILSYHLIEEKKEEKQQRIMVYAAPSLLIKNYENLTEQLELKLVSIDYNGNTIYQWLRANRQLKIDLYMQMNERNTMFTILENGTLALQRNLNFGTDLLIQSLMNSGYDKELTEDAAQELLKEEDKFFTVLNPTVEEVESSEEERREFVLKKRITEVFRPFIGNIARVLEYYNAKNKDASLTSIYVGGCGAGIKNLKELLENEFKGIEFIMMETLPELNLYKGNTLDSKKSSEYTACIGAAIPTINFVTIDEKQAMKKSLTFSVISLGVVTAISVIMIVNGIVEYQSAKNAGQKLQTKIAELASIEILEKEHKDTTQTFDEISKMDQSLYHYNEDWNEIMGYLESELPTTTHISSLSSSDEGMIMNVITNNKTEAAKVLLQLEKIPFFTSVAVNGLLESTDPETGMKAVTFSVTCSYHVKIALPEATPEGTQPNPEGTEPNTEGATNNEGGAE